MAECVAIAFNGTPTGNKFVVIVNRMSMEFANKLGDHMLIKSLLYELTIIKACDIFSKTKHSHARSHLVWYNNNYKARQDFLPTETLPSFLYTSLWMCVMPITVILACIDSCSGSSEICAAK
eukprot:1148020-Pelagomonas_calceolata.AAC.1